MGRGTLQILVANGSYLLSVVVIQVTLGRLLGPIDYGVFGVVLALFSVAFVLVTTGLPRSVSRHIAEEKSRLNSIVRESAVTQLAFSLAVAGAFAALANPIATLLRDSSLVPYIRLSALVIPATAMYAVFAGYLNGLGRFLAQAVAWFISAWARVAMVLALVFIGAGINGAIIGYAVAPMIGLLACWWFLGLQRERNATKFPLNRLLRFASFTSTFEIGLFLVTSLDLFLVKILVRDGVEVGYYAGAGVIARMLYFLFWPISITVLPSVAKAWAAGDVASIRNYTQLSLRYTLILAVPAVLLMSATSTTLAKLVFGEAYTPAGEPLAILAFGLAGLAVFRILGSIVVGIGRPIVPAIVILITLALDSVANLLLIPPFGLVGAASATTLATVIGALAIYVYVERRFQPLGDMASLAKVVVAGLAIYLVATVVSVSPPMLPLMYLALAALYVGILLLVRAVSSEDIAFFRRIVVSRKAPA